MVSSRSCFPYFFSLFLIPFNILLFWRVNNFISFCLGVRDYVFNFLQKNIYIYIFLYTLNQEKIGY